MGLRHVQIYFLRKFKFVLHEIVVNRELDLVYVEKWRSEFFMN